MSTLKSKRRRRAITKKNQRGGGFFYRLTENLPNFNISNSLNEVKKNFTSVVSRVSGSFCPPCPKPDDIPPLSETSRNISGPLVKTEGGSDNKKRRTKKKRGSKK